MAVALLSLLFFAPDIGENLANGEQADKNGDELEACIHRGDPKGPAQFAGSRMGAGHRGEDAERAGKQSLGSGRVPHPGEQSHGEKDEGEVFKWPQQGGPIGHGFSQQPEDQPGNEAPNEGRADAETESASRLSGLGHGIAIECRHDGSRSPRHPQQGRTDESTADSTDIHGHEENQRMNRFH